MMAKRRDKNRLVYSTEGPVSDIDQNPPGKSNSSDTTLYIRREVKGRGGKTVTTISCTGWSEKKIKELATELKKFCGSGGSVKSGIIILQGDQRQKILPFLEGKNFKAKMAGG
jgi:translation initiation factor 1